MKPPFEIYNRDVDIGDTEGHICTAENPEIAKEIVQILNNDVRLTLALSFARSVIKCGEPWTDECTKIIDGALASTLKSPDQT